MLRREGGCTGLNTLEMELPAGGKDEEQRRFMKVEKEEHAKGRVRWRQMICRGDPHRRRKLIIDSEWTFITHSSFSFTDSDPVWGFSL